MTTVINMQFIVPFFMKQCLIYSTSKTTALDWNLITPFFIIYRPKNPVFRVIRNLGQDFKDFLIKSGNILTSVNFECQYFSFSLSAGI